MTITEALKISKESGGERTFMRPCGGWIRWVDGCQYDLSVDDLIADDWEEWESLTQRIRELDQEIAACPDLHGGSD